MFHQIDPEYIPVLAAWIERSLSAPV
jgi:hypothetical protein